MLEDIVDGGVDPGGSYSVPTIIATDRNQWNYGTPIG